MHEPPERCDSTWIITYTGRKFWPLNPRAEDIDIEDIAHHLSQANRFAGACRFPYSVAQHCVIGSYHCERPLEFLLHDASESYLCDLPRPVKLAIPQYQVFEKRLERIISHKFGLEYPWPTCVKTTDNRMLATERNQLLPYQLSPWPYIAGVEPYETGIAEMSWREAKRKFLERFYQLTSRTNTAYEG